MTDGKLVLGPFQGKTACIEIEIGRGVCGTAVFEDKTQLVYDVHQFPGHIACDSASNSEIVVPIFKNGELVYNLPTINEIRDYCKEQIDTLWDEMLRFENPHKYYVDLSQNLWDLKHALLQKYCVDCFR